MQHGKQLLAFPSAAAFSYSKTDLVFPFSLLPTYNLHFFYLPSDILSCRPELVFVAFLSIISFLKPKCPKCFGWWVPSTNQSYSITFVCFAHYMLICILHKKACLFRMYVAQSAHIQLLIYYKQQLLLCRENFSYPLFAQLIIPA